MTRKKNLIGQTFGLWTVIGEDEPKRNKDGKIINASWKCQCVCGTIRTKTTRQLKVNPVRGCGCFHGFKNPPKHIPKSTIVDEAPWMLPLFVDKEYPLTHSLHSNKKTLVKCPTCGIIKEMSADTLYQRGHVTCGICTDGISLPNKIMRYILIHLDNIDDLKFEYYPKWAERKAYDNYFKYNDKEYIVEMDGGFHYLKNRFNGGRPLEETLKSDKIKDKLAQKHDIELIRIDCKESNFEYIKTNIIQSKLNEIFDLSVIDWAECAKFSSESIVIKVWNYYKEHSNENPTLLDIGNVFNLSTNTVMRYLKRGNDCGYLFYKNYSKNRPKKEKKPIKNNSNTLHTNSIKVIVYDPFMNIIGEYKSLNYAVIEINKIYNLDFNVQGIYSARNRYKGNNMVKYKKYYFKFMGEET